MLDEAADFAVGGIVGLFAWFFGGLDGYFSALVTFIAINFVLSTLDKLINHRFKIQELLTRIGRKITIFCLVGASHVVDKYFLGDTSAIRTGVIFFYTASEFLGMLNHAHNLGVPVPNILIEKIKTIQKKFNVKKIENGNTSEQQILDDYFDIREYINLEDTKDAEKEEQIDKIEKAELTKDFIENLTGVYSEPLDF